jgi:hypothetical protein
LDRSPRIAETRRRQSDPDRIETVERSPEMNDNPFDGKIDEVEIYDRVLKEKEILQAIEDKTIAGAIAKLQEEIDETFEILFHEIGVTAIGRFLVRQLRKWWNK